MNIVIYTKSGCPNCTTAKRLLNTINGQRVGGLAGLQAALKGMGL